MTLRKVVRTRAEGREAQMTVPEKFGKHHTKLEFFNCESEEQEQPGSKAGTPEQDSAESTGPPQKNTK